MLRTTLQWIGIALLVAGFVAACSIQRGLPANEPRPDEESAFIKSYNPAPVIQQFACGKILSQQDTGITASGLAFVRHQRLIYATLEIDEEHWVPLMQALADQLGTGPAAPTRTGPAGKGMTSSWNYQDGRSVGTVTISPLVRYDRPDQRNFPDCTPVLVNIYVEEIFVPKLPALQREIQVIFQK